MAAVISTTMLSTAVIAREGVLVTAVMAGVGSHLAVAVARLVGVKVVEGMRSTLGHRPVIAVVRVIAVVHVTDKAAGTVEPGTSADKDSTSKPIGTVVAVGSAIVRRIIEVAVGTNGRNADVNRDLSGSHGRTA